MRIQPSLTARLFIVMLASVGMASVSITKKATLDFSNHAEGQHAFDVLDDNERTREIIRRTLEFIKAHTASRMLSPVG